jgi:carboxypeptidase Taq
MTEAVAYQKLLARAREVALVDSTAALLSWDEETYMPRKALPYRAEQLAHFSGWSHRQFTAPEVGEWIRACEDQGFPRDSDEDVNVREWRRAYDRQTKLPSALVEEFSRASALARDAWVEARRRSEFTVFQPHLEKLLGLSRQMADHWGYERTPYDALLEGHERNARAAELRDLFAALRPAISEVLGPAAERGRSIPENFLEGAYPVSGQEGLNREVAAAFGFDFEAGRIDTTAHPFCTGLGPRDCRLTTRYNERDFSESFYGVLHEAGHGLYDQGLLEAHHGMPLGSAASMGIHESQSRLWENHIGRSRAFWERWYEPACRHLPALARFTPQQIHGAVNRVAPSFIRVEADQVTYDLHILLRFELEVPLVEGDLSVRDVPGVWNARFRELFGLEVPDDARGCLQDIHWSLGAFGYFPTYTLGNLNAAQLMVAARREKPDLDAELARGQYGGLLGWLRERVHAPGQRFTPQELMRRATGETTQPTAYIAALRQKFLPNDPV